MRRAVLLLALLLCQAQGPAPPNPPGFIDVVAYDNRRIVHIAAHQVTRIFHNEESTLIDTGGFARQRSLEPVDVVARRVIAAGRRMIALTDPSQQRIWLAAEAIIVVRESRENRAEGGRTAVSVVGLPLSRDLAVRESVDEVLAAIRRALAEPPAPRP
jgi:hypothetical protein